MFGFDAGRRLPLVLVVLLILVAAGIYIRFQFGRVQQALQSQGDPQTTATRSSAMLVTEPQPVTIAPSVARAQANQIRQYDDSTGTSVQPDRPVQPDVPLQH